mmetsp:Transcript_126425/g.224000  ORF Transcript_126425/g.224000 Transcript_126425/m.224000 type:complete len:242 (+) Transcript_126425:871-1596(+)
MVHAAWTSFSMLELEPDDSSVLRLQSLEVWSAEPVSRKCGLQMTTSMVTPLLMPASITVNGPRSNLLPSKSWRGRASPTFCATISRTVASFSVGQTEMVPIRSPLVAHLIWNSKLHGARGGGTLGTGSQRTILTLSLSTRPASSNVWPSLLRRRSLTRSHRETVSPAFSATTSRNRPSVSVHFILMIANKPPLIARRAKILSSGTELCITAEAAAAALEDAASVTAMADDMMSSHKGEDLH